VLTQGIKRQVRRVFAALGYKVKRLQRVRIGTLTDRGLPSGEVRLLSKNEVDLLTKRRPVGKKLPGGVPEPGVRKSVQEDGP
jgi:16S rRNA U516 pseudouridylate synthase RsuA-like enzyme